MSIKPKPRHIYVISFILVVMIFCSAQYKKQILMKAIRGPKDILDGIKKNDILLSQSLDTLFFLLPSFLPEDKIAALDTLRPLNRYDNTPAGLSGRFSLYLKTDTLMTLILNKTDNAGPEFRRRVTCFRHILSETEKMITKYNRLALQTNYQLKRFPQIFYVNLFHFNLLPEIQTEIH